MKILSEEDLYRLALYILEKKGLILCIGTELREDDRACLELCKELANLGLDAVECPFGLEMCSHIVVERRPRLIAIFDAMVSGSTPGTIALVDLDEITDILLTTHTIPINMVLKYIRSSIPDLETIVIGIEVERLGIGIEISESVRKAIDRVVEVFKKALDVISRS